MKILKMAKMQQQQVRRPVILRMVVPITSNFNTRKIFTHIFNQQETQ